MIQTLGTRYRKHVAWPLFFLFYLQLVCPLHAAARNYPQYFNAARYAGKAQPRFNLAMQGFRPGSNDRNVANAAGTGYLDKHAADKLFIGGPSSPEASTFKAVGSNNLVNLFTGDFSYSIPLLDVGGYPVNLFYNAGITMEQEASWVGLGWNINPGTVSRNMRGVPDDFNGEDTLVQNQNVKPNRTWGGEIGADAEWLGLKDPRVSMSLGFSYNNYLGPAIDLGVSASATLASIENIKYEKSATASLGISAGVGVKLSSRSGLTFSPSLNLSTKLGGENVQTGVGLSTAYNSRSGVSSLNLHAEMGFYEDHAKDAYAGTNAAQFTKGTSIGTTIGSSSISFAKPSYMPSLRMPMQNNNYSGQFEFGAGLWGFRGSVTGNGYYSESFVAKEYRHIKKPLVGFLYSEKAYSNKDAVMDFNRVNDREVTPNTPIISAPEYSYDIFSIQGEGTGGTIRAYRDDLGFMRDNLTTSKDNSFSLGADIAPPGHYGGNLNGSTSPTRTGGWDDANNTLTQTLLFRNKQSDSAYERVYFKNPGEATVTRPEMLARLGGDDLVRFKLSGSNVTPRLESNLETFDKHSISFKGDLSLTNNISAPKREKRTQVTTMLTAQEAAVIGLDKNLKSYTGSFDGNHNLQYDSLARVGGFRKKHHISEIDVLEQSGMRYVYGLPVYNVVQKDFTFSVGSLPASSADNLVNYTGAEASADNSPYMVNSSKIDGYYQSQETPAYASSFLITGLLSPDYVDVTGDGITEDDRGSAVKFNYTRSADLYKWRTPRNNASGQSAQAHFNEGIRTQKKDNKATITYGEREAWYLNSVESKSMIAIFKTESRNDARGVVSDVNGAIDTTKSANKKLTRIDLYTKADIKAKGISLAVPVKTVFFVYDTSLCKGTPDSKNGGGKLTLRSVYFTYNGQVRSAKDRYVFNYGDLGSTTDNPAYAYSASDRWGTYKDPSDGAVHPHGLNNIDYPFTDTSKVKDDKFAAAWALKKILLPSGGQMEIQYEADDYAYVQDKRACNMFSIYGLGSTTSYTHDSAMYSSGIAVQDNNYVYIKLPHALTSTTTADLKKEIYARYLEGIDQLAFKLQVKMPAGFEPLTAYAAYEDYGVCANSASKDYIYIKLSPLDGKSPLAKSAIGFLTESLPGQAFPGYETEVNDLKDFIGMAGNMLSAIKGAFKNVEQQMRDAGNAKNIVLAYSFLRLDDPAKMKYGGGYRVKKVLVRDNWKPMTKRASNPDGEYTSTYGQEYDYTTTEKINGEDRTISSGVAAYEPGIGSEENPFRTILQFSNKLPMALAQYGAVEMPMLDALYPLPMVGYSKVTVRSIHRKGTHQDSTVRSAIGKQVTEFYTSRDYPVYSIYTPMNSMEYNKDPFFSFLYKEVINRRTISQGFLVETNDMNGKMKFQAAYSESDEKTPLSASYHSYKNTGKNGLNDKVDFVYNEESGAVQKGNMGIDVELMTDVREFKLETNGLSAQGQVDIFPFIGYIWTIPTLFPLKTYQQNLYRAVTCTKLINYHAIEDSVIVMDKGSVISTKTIAYDAQTGAPVVTRTANEFNDSIFNVNYPAYWAYGGMGTAYKNIDAVYTGVNFNDGKITNISNQRNVFESGDELYLINPGNGVSGCIPASAAVAKLWAFDRTKDTSSLTSTVPDIYFMDSVGNFYTRSNATVRIVRSGKRNLLTDNVATVVTMKNPLSGGTLVVDSSSKVINAAAMEFKEKWQTDEGAFNRLKKTTDTATCITTESIDCNGYLDKNINPYLKGLLGTFRNYQSKVFYANRQETSATTTTNIRSNGYLDSFKLYWNFNGDKNLVPDLANKKWVWNTQVTKFNSKGLELETKNALNIYSAAQYGFNNSMAVAVANNSRYNEMFAESFEDNGYNESLNKVPDNSCLRSHIDLTGLANDSIVTTAGRGFNAHSGKKVMKVAANSTVAKTIQLANSIDDKYNFKFTRSDVITETVAPTGSSQKISTIPTTVNMLNTFDYYNLGLTTQIQKNPLSVTFLQYDAGSNSSHFYSYYKTTQNIKIPTTGTYTFTLTASQSYEYLWDGTATFDRAAIDLNIKNPDGSLVFNRSLYSDNASSATYSVHLNCGYYVIETYTSGDIMFAGNKTTLHTFASNAAYTSSISAITGFYVSCTKNDPIPADSTMLNPLFTLKPGKKMFFSAWVHEDCAVPCSSPDFTHSSVQVWSGGNNISPKIIRTGTIIEGWQKIEGEFTVPAGDSTAIIKFINSNGAPMYVDDIRVHPYNANLKSYVYDPATLKLSAELDENNYASFYEYDEEGQLVRVKKETIQGIKTIKETRSFKQKGITDLQ